VEKVVTALMRGGVTPDQIGVITPYEGQRAHTVTTMLRVRGSLHRATSLSRLFLLPASG